MAISTAALELWQTEWCPASHRVRQRLTELALSYTVHQVPVRGEDRTLLQARTGESSIPVLVAGGEIVGGEAAIVDYLVQHFAELAPSRDEPVIHPAIVGHPAQRLVRVLQQECPQLTAPTA